MEDDMSRGFSVTVLVSDASALTPEAVLQEALASRRLTATESESFIKSATAAAQTLLGALPPGPAWVTLSGADRAPEPGEETHLLVHVRATTQVAAPVLGAPAPVAAPEGSAPAAPEPVVAPSGAPVASEIAPVVEQTAPDASPVQGG